MKLKIMLLSLVALASNQVLATPVKKSVEIVHARHETRHSADMVHHHNSGYAFRPGGRPGIGGGGYAPGYGSIQGPGHTRHWVDHGLHRAPKFIDADLNVRLHGQYVNEILIRAFENDVEILEAYVELSNGQRLSLYRAEGTIGQNQELRFKLDRRYSLRSERVYLKVTSGLRGSRGRIQVFLGLAR